VSCATNTQETRPPSLGLSRCKNLPSSCYQTRLFLVPASMPVILQNDYGVIGLKRLNTVSTSSDVYSSFKSG
jgi:hypothetical protein